MPTKDWAEMAKSLLKAELKRRNVGYRELAEKRTAMGSPETEPNIANKISQGGFTAAFFIQCLSAVGCITLRLCGPKPYSRALSLPSLAGPTTGRPSRPC